MKRGETPDSTRAQLDEAINQLGERDRNAIVLRYFEHRSLERGGGALGIGADAAQKCVSRPWKDFAYLCQTRCNVGVCAHRGAVFSQRRDAAPAGLTAILTAAAAKGAAVGGSTLALVKAASKIVAWTKAKDRWRQWQRQRWRRNDRSRVTKIAADPAISQPQALGDGSTLILNRVDFAGTKVFLHGSGFEKVSKMRFRPRACIWGIKPCTTCRADMAGTGREDTTDRGIQTGQLDSGQPSAGKPRVLSGVSGA